MGEINQWEKKNMSKILGQFLMLSLIILTFGCVGAKVVKPSQQEMARCYFAKFEKVIMKDGMVVFTWVSMESPLEKAKDHIYTGIPAVLLKKYCAKKLKKAFKRLHVQMEDYNYRILGAWRRGKKIIALLFSLRLSENDIKCFADQLPPETSSPSTKPFGPDTGPRKPVKPNTTLPAREKDEKKDEEEDKDTEKQKVISVANSVKI